MSDSTDKSTNGSASSFHAFISYASANKDKAHAICESLEAKGLRCWIAPRDVRPGSEYGEEIMDGIRDSRCLVLVLSESANESPMVRREVERAVSSSKPVFPIRIEEVLPARSLEFFISATHWIDAWEGVLVNHAERLAEELLDERLVEEARDTLVSRKRRRKFVRQASLSSVVMIVITAIALTFAFTRDSGTGGGDMFGEGYDPVRSFAESQGLDIDQVDESDFEVSFIQDYKKLHVYAEATPEIETIANHGMLQIRVGEQPWAMLVHDRNNAGMTHYLSDADYELDGPIQIRFFPNDGRVGSPTHGPYTFDLSVAEERRRILEERIVQAEGVLESGSLFKAQRMRGWLFTYETMRDIQDIVRSIEVGASEDEVDTSWVLPRVERDRGSRRDIFGEIPLDTREISTEGNNFLKPLTGRDTFYGRVTFIDGSESSWKRFDRVTSLIHESPEDAAGSLTLNKDGTSTISFRKLLEVGFAGDSSPYHVQITNLTSGVTHKLDVLAYGAETGRIDPWLLQSRKKMGFAIPLGWSRVRSEVIWIDGEVLASEDFSVEPTPDWHRVPSASEGAPSLFADINPSSGASPALNLKLPRGTVSVLYGQGALPSNRLERMSWPSNTMPVLMDDFRLMFQLEDGSELGPYMYDLKYLGGVLQRLSIEQTRLNYRRILRAVRRTGESEPRISFNSTDVSGMLQSTGLPRDAYYEEWIRGKKPGVIITPNDLEQGTSAWSAISKIRAGTSPDALDRESDVRIDLDSFIRTPRERHRLRTGDSKMDLLWLPVDSERVFLEIELFDGSAIGPFEIPVVDLADR